MRLVERIAPDHGQIGMLLVLDEAFWAPLLSRSPGPGSAMEASYVALGWWGGLLCFVPFPAGPACRARLYLVLGVFDRFTLFLTLLDVRKCKYNDYYIFPGKNIWKIFTGRNLIFSLPTKSD